MTFWSRVFRRKEQVAREVEDEIAFYLEMRAKEFEREGMTAEQAMRAAEEAFGDPERVHDRVVREVGMRSRWMGWWELFASFVEDVRLGMRGLRKELGFTAVAVTTLALGIGANSAIYSVASQALFRGPPVRDAESVVAVCTTSRRGRRRFGFGEPRTISSERRQR